MYRMVLPTSSQHALAFFDEGIAEANGQSRCATGGQQDLFVIGDSKKFRDRVMSLVEAVRPFGGGSGHRLPDGLRNDARFRPTGSGVVEIQVSCVHSVLLKELVRFANVSEVFPGAAKNVTPIITI
jgi:hypothetical protein